MGEKIKFADVATISTRLFVFFGFGVEHDLVGGPIFVCIGCFGAGLGICLGICFGFGVCFDFAKCCDVGCGFGFGVGFGICLGFGV